MNQASDTQLRIGAWYVNPVLGEVCRDGAESVRLEARTMRLLVYLAAHRGEVVSIDELLDQVWSGVIVTPDSVYQAIASLRRLLGDDAKRPEYIATVPRQGYRLVATVDPWFAEPPFPVVSLEPAPTQVRAHAPNLQPPVPHSRKTATLVLVIFLAAGIVFGAAGWIYSTRASSIENGASGLPVAMSISSLAVLPFLDLTTQEMGEEVFADGMTEELIDRLSQISGLKVPGPASSFYYKDKQLPVAQIGKELGVDYLLDGSIRKSESAFHVSMRMVRAADGYVVWSENDDRPMSDGLKAQQEIATRVARSVQASINAASTSALVH